MNQDGHDFKLENQRYRIVKQIGKGGMGYVYLAYDLHLQRDVAIKTLLPGLMPVGAGSEQAVRRFELEADILKKLRHTHIIEFIDYFLENENQVIVMEYVAEGSVRKRIYEQHRLFNSREVCALGMRLASALTAAHDLGIIHRDIKPSNILLPEDGMVRLSDFGVARLKGNGLFDPDQSLTNINQLPGTVVYMSPERLWMGSKADELSDVWALGVVFYEMLAGYPPFKGMTNEETARMIQEEVVPPIDGEAPDVWPALVDIIHQSLSKDPKDRFPSMRSVGAALDKALRQEGVVDEQPSLQESLKRLFDRVSLPEGKGTDRSDTMITVGDSRAASIWGTDRPSQYAAEYSSSLALVFGASRYQDRGLAAHPQAEFGAQLAARALEQRYRFDVITLLRDKVTLSAVRQAFRALQDTQPDDRVVIYWAGAARIRKDRYGSEMSFLAAHDTAYDDWMTYLELEDLIDIRFIKAKHIMFILDAPVLGPRRLATADGQTANIDLAMQNSAVHLLTPGNKPYTNPGEITLFTEQMLKGLYGQAADSDGIISGDSLGEYVARTVNLESDGVQQPLTARLGGGEQGTFLFHVPLNAYLPEEVRRGVNSSYGVMRLNMVQVLKDFAQQSGKVQQAALTYLKRMATEDKSQSVKGAALKVLNELMDGQGGTETGRLIPPNNMDLD